MKTSDEKLMKVHGSRRIIELLINGTNSFSLSSAFTWAQTPQGHVYWYNKNQKFYRNNSHIDQEDLSYLKWLLRDDPVDEGE